MAYSWNTTTVAIASGPQAPLRDARVRVNGQEIDVTGAADAAHTWEAGLPDTEITLTIVGVGTVAAGGTGTTVVTLANTQGTVTLTNARVIGRRVRGQLDGEITTEYTIVPGQ